MNPPQQRALAARLAGTLIVTAALLFGVGPAARAAVVLTAGEATIALETAGSPPRVGLSRLQAWVTGAASIVRGYYGAFPVPRVSIFITVRGAGAAVDGGRTFGGTLPRIEVEVGKRVSDDALTDDWVLVHEMVHLALPEVDEDQNWLAEGIATYVEGVARVRAGNLAAGALWQEYYSDMPRGLPGIGDRGLDHTHTWARTYWGGALYCLVADVRIHQLTANRRGLNEALRAIRDAGGGMREVWSVKRILDVGDAATGTTVLADLYHDMAEQPSAPDLAQLFRDLGVEAVGGRVRLRDDAPLAAVRRAITAPPVQRP